MMQHFIRTVLATSTVFALLSCSTQHHAVDKQVSSVGTKIDKLVVFGLSEDRKARINFEEYFSAAMTAAGVTTEATYPLLSELDSLQSEQQVRDMYLQTGANYGLTVEVIAPDKAPPSADGIFFGTWLAGLALDSPEMRAVGTYGGIGARFARESYRLRMILWDAQSAQSVWNVVTDSHSNDNARTDAEKLAELVASELRADGFLD